MVRRNIMKKSYKIPKIDEINLKSELLTDAILDSYGVKPIDEDEEG